MNKEVIAYNYSNNDKHLVDVDIASCCPRCGVTLIPNILYAFLIECPNDDSQNKVFLMNFCSNCDECFISRHSYDEYSDVYIFDSSAPVTFRECNFSENIQKLSPQFISIYNESSYAESLKMDSICGMGYRKALEFLVKDYAIFLRPEDSEKIFSLPLAKCIEQHISSPKLNTLAKASVWLGNDETHYIKKHSDYGLPELKAFITAFVTYVDSELALLDADKLLSS